MTFRIGQKVVCVDDRPQEGASWDVPPQKGAVYTVQWVGFHRYEHFLEALCVYLCEINRPSGLPFFATRFRPIVERKTETGMAILREILDRESHQDKPPVKRTVHS